MVSDWVMVMSFRVVIHLASVFLFIANVMFPFPHLVPQSLGWLGTRSFILVYQKFLTRGDES